MIIAAALAQLARSASEPEPGGSSVLLLDEPTAALDLAYQLEIAALLRDLHRAPRHHHRRLDARSRTSPPPSAGSLVLLREGRVLAVGPDVATC